MGGSTRRTSVFGGIGIAIVTLVLMVATEPHLAIVWDEGYTLGREARVRQWLRALRDPRAFAATWRPLPPVEELVQPMGPAPPRPDQVATLRGLMDPRVLAWFWPFAREEPHGHPPFYAIVGLAGDILAPAWATLPRARLGPMIVFSVTAGVLFAFLAAQRGAWAGTAGAGAWVLQPRLFAHGHYALYDALLTSLWVGSILAFLKAIAPGDPAAGRPRLGWSVAFGLLAGAAAGTKLTGWFLPLPFLAWTAIRRDRRAGLVLIVGGLVAVAALYIVIPPWWAEPIEGPLRFLRSNLTRGQTTLLPTAFLGQVYLTPKGSLPWYNTLVWTVFVTPVGFLALALAGAGWALRSLRDQPSWSLVVLHWAFLLALRALPHTPGHDAERQFLPAFGCLALLAGLGGGWAAEALGRRGKAVVVAALAEGAIGLAAMMPVPLSYYSPLVGGLPGAARLGMEPTYYWDALTDDALGRLNALVRPGQTILLPSETSSFRYLRQSGKLKPDFLWFSIIQPGVPVPPWYVVQNRTGAFTPMDRALIARARPENVLVSKWGVPLVWVFPNLGTRTSPDTPAPRSTAAQVH